jgi:hypothetical protein
VPECNLTIGLKGFWQINLEAVNVNNVPIARGLSTIVDTGTTLIYGDTNSVTALYRSIPGSKNASRVVGNGFFTGNYGFSHIIPQPLSPSIQSPVMPFLQSV